MLRFQTPVALIGSTAYAAPTNPIATATSGAEERLLGLPMTTILWEKADRNKQCRLATFPTLKNGWFPAESCSRPWVRGTFSEGLSEPNGTTCTAKCNEYYEGVVTTKCIPVRGTNEGQWDKPSADCQLIQIAQLNNVLEAANAKSVQPDGQNCSKNPEDEKLQCTTTCKDGYDQVNQFHVAVEEETEIRVTFSGKKWVVENPDGRHCRRDFQTKQLNDVLQAANVKTFEPHICSKNPEDEKLQCTTTCKDGYHQVNMFNEAVEEETEIRVTFSGRKWVVENPDGRHCLPIRKEGMLSAVGQLIGAVEKPVKCIADGKKIVGKKNLKCCTEGQHTVPGKFYGSTTYCGAKCSLEDLLNESSARKFRYYRGITQKSKFDVGAEPMVLCVVGYKGDVTPKCNWLGKWQFEGSCEDNFEAMLKEAEEEMEALQAKKDLRDEKIAAAREKEVFDATLNKLEEQIVALKAKKDLRDEKIAAARKKEEEEKNEEEEKK